MNPKEVALAHFEKAILGVCVAVFVWYLYSVLSIKPYSRKPEEFTDATTKASQYVKDPNRKLPEVEAKQLTSINFVEEAGRLFKEYVPDDVKEYLHLTRWVRPFDYGVTFRNEPKLLAAAKPEAQSNRGLMQTYLIDAAGKIRTQKVPKGKMRFGKPAGEKNTGRGGRTGPGGGRGRGGQSSGTGSSMPPGGYGGSSSGTGNSAGPPGEGGEGGFGDEMMGSSMMGGGNSSGVGMPEMGGGDEGGEPGRAPSKTTSSRGDVRNKIIERLNKKDGKDEKKDKKEEEVEEPIESREGYRFVEICTTFPHSDQIVEYTKALREQAKFVKLEYASIDVERSELLPNFTWSEFKPVPIKEQFDYVMSAIGHDRETSPSLVRGLAMNVPLLDVQQREYLHKKFPIYEKAEQAMYTKAELDPAGEEFREAERIRKQKMINPEYKAKKKEKNEDEEKKYLPDRQSGANLGFNDPNKKQDGKIRNRYELKTALVRYWDFTVEPGRKYKYRMRIKVFNPNYKRNDVAESEAASRVLLVGPWSPVSDEVFVDFDNHWYVAEQKGSGKRSNELTLEVHHWYRGMGEWLVSAFPQRIGQFVGLTEKPKPIKALKWNDMIHEYEVKELKMDAEFDTGNLLVGMFAGNEDYDLFGSTRTVAMPKEAVALNPFGDLVRHEESIDKGDGVRKSVNENFEGMAKTIASLTGEDKKKDEEKDPTKPGKGKRGR